MPHVSYSTEIPHGDREAVLDAIWSSERFPEFMDDVLEVTVTHVDDEGWRHASWVTRMGGLKMRWVQKDRRDGEEGRIRFTQVEGDLKIFQGDWVVEPRGDGLHVALSVEFELANRALGNLFNPFASALIRSNSAKMIEALRRRYGAEASGASGAKGEDGPEEPGSGDTSSGDTSSGDTSP